MEIKKGFKYTDVWLIPNDWRLKPLPEIIWFQEGPGLRNWQFKSGGLKVINVTNLEENGFLNLDTTKRHISWDEFEKMYKHFLIDEGDVVIASSGNSYCKTAVVRKQDLPLLMNTSVIRFKPLNGLDYWYMLTYLKSNYFKMQIDFLITGGAQPNFGPAHLRKIFVPLPPTKAEQTAIATALNDADALISELEKLIAKKRSIKQGALQELLKPKEGWEVKLLKEVIDNFIDYRGVTPKKLGMEWGNGDIPALSANNVQMGYVDFEKECYYGSEELYLRWMRNGDCGKDDVLITMEAPLGNIAYIPDDKKYILSQRTVLLKSSNLIDKVFLRFYLMNSDFQKKLLENASGSTAQGIQRKTLEKLELVFPVNKNEQTRIAQILSDMDAEIEALEKKLDKYKKIKQGMVQNLLTGRIRLT